MGDVIEESFNVANIRLGQCKSQRNGCGWIMLSGTRPSCGYVGTLLVKLPRRENGVSNRTRDEGEYK